MSEQTKVLERIREALRAPAPPGSGHSGGPRAAFSTPRDFRQVLPLAGQSFEHRLELFRRNAADLKTEFDVVQSTFDAAALLETIRAREGWKTIALHDNPLVESATAKLNVNRLDVTSGYTVNDLEKCSVGITACDALVAQTGSVLVTSRSAGGRALSVLPPHHVVLASADQLLADLPQAFEFLKKKYSVAYPSFISLITGPSRTGDIERILVLGAHGPKKLTIILVMEP